VRLIDEKNLGLKISCNCPFKGQGPNPKTIEKLVNLGKPAGAEEDGDQ
jgi:hypothetical protein